MVIDETKLLLNVLPIIALSSLAVAAQPALPGKAVQLSEKYPKLSTLKGVSTAYSERLASLIKAWPGPRERGLKEDPKLPIQFTCLSTAGNDLYIGLEQAMWVSAPIERVAGIMNDMDAYENIIPGFKDVKVTGRDGNLVMTAWEQIVPIPFVSNIEYEMTYLINVEPQDKGLSERRYYRYQLQKAGQIKASDGVIVLDSLGPEKTRYVEYDFFDADWGFAKILGKNGIWNEGIESILHGDVNIKLKAENPEWTDEAVIKAGKQEMKKIDLDGCQTKADASQVFGG
jgi:hypothetical protein